MIAHTFRWIGSIVILSCVSSITLGETPQKLAVQIDQEFRTVWKQAGIQIGTRTSDAEFLRRVTLDLVGRIPTTFEVREFLGDQSLDKRERTIDRLLESPEYAQHWANVWRHELLPQSDTPAFRNLSVPFESWLRAELRNKSSYRSLVQEIMTASMNRDASSAAVSFLAAAEMKPANLAANSSRVFLGINLDCAQCHDHPFARWSKQQFWQYAAFFTAPTSAEGQTPRLEIAIPESSDVAQAQWLTADPVSWPASVDRETGRRVLATWMTSSQNPYFARNAVNRVWAHLMGRGLVEPLDDLSDLNAPAMPKVFDLLTAHFIATDYNLALLIATIARLEAYQLTSASAHKSISNTDGPWLFQTMPVRGLSGEQIYSSLLTAAGATVQSRETNSYYATSDRERFIAAFTPDRPARAQRSVLQALELMNGSLSAELLNGKTVSAISDAPFLSAGDKLETLYLAILNRQPLPEETADFQQALPALEQGNPDALKAVFWVLINSAEFGVNH